MIQRDSFLPIFEEFPGQKLKMVECMKNYPQIAKQLTKTGSCNTGTLSWAIEKLEKDGVSRERNNDGTVTVESECYNVHSAADSSTDSDSSDGNSAKEKRPSAGKKSSENSRSSSARKSSVENLNLRRKSAAMALTEITKAFSR